MEWMLGEGEKRKSSLLSQASSEWGESFVTGSTKPPFRQHGCREQQI
jgi:hypothetical protein